MKAFGVVSIIIGVLAVIGGVALGILPIGYDSPAGMIDCGAFFLTALAGGTQHVACLPVLFGYAWMIPTIVVGGIVVILVGALFIQSGRVGDLRRTLAYTRTSKGLSSSTNPPTLSGNGVPTAASAGITSNEQASYAAQAGYTRTPAAPSYQPAPQPAPAALAQPVPLAQPAPLAQPVPLATGYPVVQPTPTMQAAPAPAPAFAQAAAGETVMPGSFSAAQQTAAPVAVAPQQVPPAPAAQPAPGAFVQPGSGFAPHAGSQAAAY